MSLTIDQQYNCLSCSDRTRNMYVDDVYNNLISWLNAYTCIGWFRSYENGQVPESTSDNQSDNGTRRKQFGVVDITSRAITRVYNPKNMESGDELTCVGINQEHQYKVTLHVFRESGGANRSQFNMDELGAPLIGSASDILIRLRGRHRVPRVKKFLTDNGLAITSFSEVTLDQKVENQTWEHKAQMDIDLTVCAMDSLSDLRITCVNLEICGNENKLICGEKEDGCND